MALRTGKVIIAKNIKLDKSYKDVLTYTESQMQQLVSDNSVASSTHCSFIKVDKNVISTDFSYSDAIKCNYMAMQNPNYSGKWFFAFIDDVEYINDSTTNIHFTIDEFSTWYDYWYVNKCFVIREHVTDDTIGVHTIPENLELGEYKINATTRDSSSNTLKLVMASTVVPSDPDLTSTGGTYNGVYSAIGYYTYDATNMNLFIKDIVDNNKSEAIQSIFLAPEWLLPQSGGGVVEQTATPLIHALNVSPITQLDGYSPRNNKLLTYPYVYLLGSNMNGASAVYRQEFFTPTSGNLQFMIFGVLSPGCSIKMVPTPYNGKTNNFDEGLVLGKYPQCNWITDMFTNWVTQQGVNVGIQGAVGVGETVAGVMTENPALAVKGFTSVASAVNQVRVASMMPPQAKGSTNGSDVVTASGENKFTVYSMTIRQEYAKVIDDYFHKYGYKVNRIKTPSFNGRTNFNYVQIGADENIGYSTLSNKSTPAKSMEIINDIFRRGVTLWHSHSNLGDYSVSNTIVS